MESAQISQHQVAVYAFARNASGWFTTKELVKKTGVNARTARLHLLRRVQLRVLARRQYFSACYYRLIPVPDDRAGAYARQLQEAMETFERPKRKGIGAKLAALFAKQPKRTDIADGMSPDLAIATLAFELAHIGRLSRAPRADYFERVRADFEDAWQYQEQHQFA